MLPSLPAFGIDLERLRGVVARIAIVDDSAPSRAVLNSVLALAALYKFGNQRQASRFIAAALSSLRASVQKGIRLQQGLQHIVAGMLICSFEVSVCILIPESSLVAHHTEDPPVFAVLVTLAFVFVRYERNHQSVLWARIV